jgi:hypothetical protein
MAGARHVPFVAEAHAARLAAPQARAAPAPASAPALLQQVAGRDGPVTLPAEDSPAGGLPPDGLADEDLPDEGGAAAWLGRRTSRWPDWPLPWLLAGKRRLGATVSVVIPARNEQRTVARVVTALVGALTPAWSTRSW